MTFGDRVRAARSILIAARHTVIVAAILCATAAAAPGAGNSLPRCSDPPIVATITVVDGMPFITPRRPTFRAVAPAREARMRDFALFDGRDLLARLSFAPDGSIQVMGSVAVSADGASLRVITDRPGHCVNDTNVVAKSAPTWHLVPISSVN